MRLSFVGMALTCFVIGCCGCGSDTQPPPASTYYLSGTVSGAVASGVTVTLTGARSATTTTSGSGFYAFSGLADGSYRVTPSLTGYTFAPASIPAVVSGADVSGQDFTAAALPGAFSIAGRVRGAYPVLVTVGLTGTATASTTTDANGDYSFNGLEYGTYVVTPDLAGYAFFPAATTVTTADTVSGGIDFFWGSDDALDARLTTPATDAVTTIPVVIIRFLPTNDGITLDVARATDYGGLGDISLDDLKRNIDAYNVWGKFMLEEGSRYRGYKDSGAKPYLGYTVLKSWTVYDQVPLSARFRWGTVDGYPVPFPDFLTIAARFDLRHYVEDLGVKEVWIWFGQSAMPGWPSYDAALHKPENFVEFIESNMASPTTGDISNSYRTPDDLPIFSTTYVVYCYNFRRSQAEMIHDHGHQLESLYKEVARRQDGNFNLFVSDFSGWGPNYSTPPLGRAGDCHHPPNTSIDYDYLNMTWVDSDIEDWRPDGSGVKKSVNASTWGDIPYAWPSAPIHLQQAVESQWYIYWMQNMPGDQNAIPYQLTTMTNWWQFTADWDSAIQGGVGLHH